MTKEQLAYQEYSKIYDQFHEMRLGEDIRFWQEEARVAGSPILELGCGSGRLILPIARQGINIHGIDNSPEMLGLLEQRVTKELPKTRTFITWEFGDMRSFDTQPRQYMMVFIAFSALQYLDDRDDQRVALTKAHSALKENGVFVVDIFNPNPEVIQEWGKPLFLEEVKGSSSNDSYQWFCVPEFYDSNTKILTMPNLFQFYRNNITEPETIMIPAEYYCFSKDELKLLFEQTGFGEIQTFGDYDKSPFTQNSRKIIMMGRKKD